jgi:hypothetical protein
MSYRVQHSTLTQQIQVLLFILEEVLSTPNITENVHHSLLDNSAVCAMQKILKLSSDGGDSGSKQCK